MRGEAGLPRRVTPVGGPGTRLGEPGPGPPRPRPARPNRSLAVSELELSSLEPLLPGPGRRTGSFRFYGHGMITVNESQARMDDAPRTQAQLFAQKKRRDMELKKNQTGVPTDDDLRVHF